MRQPAGGPYLQPLAGTDPSASLTPAQEPPPILVGKVVHYLAAQYHAQAVNIQECIRTLQGKGRVDNATVTGYR